VLAVQRRDTLKAASALADLLPLRWRLARPAQATARLSSASFCERKAPGWRRLPLDPGQGSSRMRRWGRFPGFMAQTHAASEHRKPLAGVHPAGLQRRLLQPAGAPGGLIQWGGPPWERPSAPAKVLALGLRMVGEENPAFRLRPRRRGAGLGRSPASWAAALGAGLNFSPSASSGHAPHSSGAARKVGRGLA